MKKTVAFCTLGCKVNQYETDAMRGSFEAEGYEVKEFSQEASVYVINTCTVTNMADRKSRQMMHRAKKKNPDGIIVAVGCYVQAAKEQLEEDTLIDLVIGNNMKSQVVQIVEQYIQDNRHTEDRDAYVADIAHSHEYETMQLKRYLNIPVPILRSRMDAISFVPTALSRMQEDASAAEVWKIFFRRFRH